MFKPFFKFKDQPNGQCMKCKWNKTGDIQTFHCDIPLTHLTNSVCISKRQMVFIDEAAYHLENMDWRS